MKKHFAALPELAASLLFSFPAHSASAAKFTDEFDLFSLKLDNNVATDSERLTDDGNAFVALNGKDLHSTGDSDVVEVSGLSTLTSPSGLTNFTTEEGALLFTDLKTQTSKLFERTFTKSFLNSLTGITNVDSAGDPVVSTVSLSSEISFDMVAESC